jgi:quinoprotein glucose dehydrogenase
MARWRVGRTALAILTVLTAAPSAQQGTRDGEWRSHSADPGSTKYAPLDQINRDNVSRLRIAWRRPSVDETLRNRMPPGRTFSGEFRATPLMIDGVLYAPNSIGLVEAFDAATGETVWVQPPFPDEPQQGLAGDSTRGIAYWTDGTVQRLFSIRGESLIALDLRTGRPVAAWGDGGRVNLKRGLGPWATTYLSRGGPHVCNDVVMAGGYMSDAPARKEQPPGDVQAFDVRTGRPRWTFKVIPRPGEVGNDHMEGRLVGVHGRRQSLVADQR